MLIRQTFFKGFPGIMIENYPRSLIPASAMQSMFYDWTILVSVSVISYLHLEIKNAGRLRTNLYDKRDDFTFPIVNFTLISINIPASLRNRLSQATLAILGLYTFVFLFFCFFCEIGIDHLFSFCNQIPTISTKRTLTAHLISLSTNRSRHLVLEMKY